LNIYHDQAHYIISYGGENGLRVNPQSSTADIDNPQTSASVSLHIEEDLVNIAQMGRKWFGDRATYVACNRKACIVFDLRTRF
jgi:hypothetical protein